MSKYGNSADITGSLIVDGGVDLGSGDDDVYIDSDTVFVDASTNRVGIKTESPAYELHVAGDMGVNEYIYHNGDTDTFIRFEDDEVNIYAGGRQMIKMVQDSTEKITINNGGMDVDLQVKGENEPNLIRTNAANDNIGIGTSSPSTSAILELSSSDHGFMLPRVLEASKPTATSALNGLMIYEEDTHRLKIVADGEWHTIKYDE